MVRVLFFPFSRESYPGVFMIRSSDIQSVQSARVPRIHLVLAFLAFILLGCNDGALGVLMPSIRAFYHIDAATISWLFFMSVVGYLLASFNTGLLMAKLGERHFLLAATAIFLVGVGLFSLRLPLVLYLCTGTVVGFGVGMLDAGLNAYVASLPRNASLLNYLHAFYGAGALLGPLIASTLLAVHFGWQATYMSWFGLALVVGLGFWFTFKPHMQPVKQIAGEKREPILFKALRLRAVWLGAFFLLFYVGTEVSLGSWGYSFLTVARLGPATVSAWIVSGYWCGLTLGRLTLAALVQSVGARRLITFCIGGVALGLVLAWFIPGIWGAALGFWLTGFSLGPLFPTTIALMPQLVSPRLLPTAIGFLTSFGSAGAALFPSLAGNLIQRLGFWFLLPFALMLTVVLLGIWLLLPKKRLEGP
jgi:fucose permease